MREKTILKEALFGKVGEEMAVVALPHTWNALDGEDGGADYYRGHGIYEIALPDPKPGKKQYVEFEGANHIAEVSLNGQVLGCHKGGFSTFRFDLTEAMQEAGNTLRVDVTNEECDVYPQMADFTFFGGIYRPSAFIEVEQAHFDLLKAGTDAVFVTGNPLGRTRIDAFTVGAEGCQVVVTMYDAEGKPVATGKGAACEHTVVELIVSEPHLWNGLEDPYVYDVKAQLVKGEELVDEVQVSYGYRTFHVDPNSGFYLNGRSLPLRGVSRHQDRIHMGWAIGEKEHQEDLEYILEVGANTLRLAHYQHAQYFYDLCDRAGLILWAEIPMISGFRKGKDAYDNTISQMTELVAQNYNHPSICFWGISNEITLLGDSEELRNNLRDLHALAKRLDPGRLTTIANVSTCPMNSEHNYITDVVSYNHYFGWYAGTPSDNGPWFDMFHEKHPDRAVGCSEYGADAVLDWHTAKPMNHDYTEEYQAFYHHEFLKCIEKRPYIWSVHAWNMFDFAADARNEGGSVGKNSKGLMSYDRRIKKEAFYICQAYWSKKPMVHVCGERFRDRGPAERNVIVYTNQPAVTLMLNGAVYGSMEAVDHACVFENLPLKEGENQVWAVAGEAVVNGGNAVAGGSGECLMSNIITLCPVDAPNPAYTYPRGENDVPVGNWFDGAALGTSDDDMEFPEGAFSVKDTVKEVMANDAAKKALIAALADIGAFGPITAVKTSAMPIPLETYLPMVGNLPAGGMSYVNKALNGVNK